MNEDTNVTGTTSPVEKEASERKTSDKTSVDWIAEASHELRLPIANIKLLVETLLDGAIDDRDAAIRMLKRTQQEVDRLQSLVVNLLSVEQVAQSLSDVQGQWVSLEEAGRYAIESTGRLAKSKNISVSMDIQKDWVIYANADQLSQVLLNLVENAIKFTDEGGRVTVKSGIKPGSFEVIDTGIGMAQEEIPKIFKRFYRIDRAKSRGSTGLGLSIVKHIADLHGAKIVVTSKEGEGSQFLFEFPGPKAGKSGGE